MKQAARFPLEIGAAEAAAQAAADFPIIDIRSEAQRAAGGPRGAITLAPDSLPESLDQLPGVDAKGALIICAQGISSLELVKRLHKAGHEGFVSVRGGFNAWRAQGLPGTWPDGFDASSSERYARHLAMPGVGIDGQQKLRRARVLLIGMGGLNSPAALYLAAAGVGTLGLVDDDIVERSNLQRQIVHTEDRVGQAKVESAAIALRQLNPDVELVQIRERLDDSNASRQVKGWHVVVDGTDNFEARYAVNRACLAQNIPLVYGAVMRFQGQVSVFWPEAPRTDPQASAGPCFRCFAPQPPSALDAPSCAEAGVLGVMPGIVGTLQATEAIKLILGAGRSLAGRLLMIDVLSMEFREAGIAPLGDCPDCGAGRKTGC